MIECFSNLVGQSDRIEIAVGYISRASLEELDSLVLSNDVKHISLTIGMYYIEGMPEFTYKICRDINKKWRESGIGEIRLVRTFKYHGKVYCFYNGNKPFSCIIGSANLGAIKLDANNRRQYEISACISDPNICEETSTFLGRLNSPNCTANIEDVTDLKLIREANISLSNIDSVSQMPDASVKFYRQHLTTTKFELPIKVPCENEKHIDDGKHFTKSNINVCYAAPRSKRKSRDWYEVQMTVSKDITRKDGYPNKNSPFFVVTDDGYWFKAHTTSDGNKQFSAVGDELIIGRWIKGRLAAAGLVVPVNDTQMDTSRNGMITYEMLQFYGSDSLILSKTDQRALDDSSSELDVWFLSFEPKSNDTEVWA